MLFRPSTISLLQSLQSASPPLRRTTSSTLFVQYASIIDIKRDLQNKIYGLVEHFRRNDAPVTHVVFVEENMTLSGYGYFYLDERKLNPALIDRLISKFHGMPLDEENSYVIQRATRPQKLFVGIKANFKKSVERCEDAIMKDFSRFGEIEKLAFPRTRGLAFPLGYFFLTYVNPDDAQTAMVAMEGKPGPTGRPMTISWTHLKTAKKTMRRLGELHLARRDVLE